MQNTQIKLLKEIRISRIGNLTKNFQFIFNISMCYLKKIIDNIWRIGLKVLYENLQPTAQQW